MRPDVSSSLNVSHMQVGGKVTFAHEVTELARADGFATKEEFFQFFHKTHGMPFHGVLIKW